MGERAGGAGPLMDDLWRSTRFRTLCPSCGRVGRATRLDQCADLVACPGCGARYEAGAHTYRPATQGMTEGERAERRRLLAREYARARASTQEGRGARAEARRRWRVAHGEEARAAERERKRRQRRRERKETVETRKAWLDSKIGGGWMSGVQNTLIDLNNHLFAQLERLGDEGLTGEELKAEVERARAVSGVASQIVSNANTLLGAYRFADEQCGQVRLPRMLTGGE